VRWRPTSGEIVAPSQFIPAAEQTDIIRDIGAWILRRACRDARPWHANHGTTVGVNVSGRQLDDPTFAETVFDALAEAGLPGSALVLELTESSLTEKAKNPSALGQLDRLRKKGVRIAIDDFGSGPSSPSALPRLPIDLVKIDSSLTLSPPGANSHQPNWAFVSATLQMVFSLKLSAVAEGIETSGQAETLRQLNCPYGQGFYFSPPVPTGRIGDLLHRPAALQHQ
jgi:EAL domain-containing protein (putative c-di-GMP-specific phosphodiesterase class I)